jgi:predicted enzyme related to lactoylglutathione lyase
VTTTLVEDQIQAIARLLGQLWLRRWIGSSQACSLGPVNVERVDFALFLTQDIVRAKTFYSETVGLKMESECENYVEVRLGQLTLGIFSPPGTGPPFVANRGGLAIRVPDVSAARTELEAKGVEFDGDTIDTGVCRKASFFDPDGNALMLHRRYAPLPDGRIP